MEGRVEVGRRCRCKREFDVEGLKALFQEKGIFARSAINCIGVGCGYKYYGW